MCENQGKQSEFSNHWKLIKLFLKKITGDDLKKIKKLSEIQVSTKYFTSSKIIFKFSENESNTYQLLRYPQ